MRTTAENSKHTTTESRELIVLLQTEGEFELDFQDTAETVTTDQHQIQEQWYRQFSDNADTSLLYFGLRPPSPHMTVSLRYLHLVASTFIRTLASNPDLERLREKTIVEAGPEVLEHLVNRAPYLNGSEHLSTWWIMRVWEKLNRVFAEEIQAYEGSAANFMNSQNSNLHVAGRIFFHLVESKKGEFPFGFLATYASASADEGKSKHLPLKNALIEYGQNSSKLLELLSTVNKASVQSAFIRELVDEGEIFHPIGLTADEAYTFLKEIPLYEQSGIICRIPNWWKNKSNSPKLTVRIGEKSTSYLSANALVDFHAELSLGDEAMTSDEIRKLLTESEGLSFIKGKWIEVNHEKLKVTLKAYEQAEQFSENTAMSLSEAMRFQLHAQRTLNISEEATELEVTNGEWLETVLTQLIRPDRRRYGTGKSEMLTS